jgi:hypothetical protein
VSSCDASRCEKIVGLVADTPNLVGVLGVGAGAVQLQPKKAWPDTDKFPIGCDELGGSGASRSSTSSRSRPVVVVKVVGVKVVGPMVARGH